MDRIKVKYEDVISIENLIAADQITRFNSDYTFRVGQFDRDWYNNINRLYLDLKHFSYKHSGYDVFTRTGVDGKKRTIHVCKNYRDRIVQKATVIASKGDLINKLVGNTYSSVPDRGAHKAIYKIKEVVKNRPVYILQCDIHHFFEEVDQNNMTETLSCNFKDQRLVWLFRQMMSAVGKGIVLGAEDSQWHGNLYLAELDQLVLQSCKPENYFRYCDDIVLIDMSATKLERSIVTIENYVHSIDLHLKPSKRIFRLAEKRRMKGLSGSGSPLDFLGYAFYQMHTDLRTTTKNRWRRRLHILNRIPGDRPADRTDVAAYGSITGLLKHCNSKNLLKKWKNEYPNYFERLRRREAAKAAITERQKEELAAILERTKRTGDPVCRGRDGDGTMVGGLCAATLSGGCDIE